MWQVVQRLYPGVGCSDNGCIFGHPDAPGTNGGCECLKETHPVQLRRSILMLQSVARTLAALISDAQLEKGEVPDDPLHPNGKCSCGGGGGGDCAWCVWIRGQEEKYGTD